MSFLTGVSYPQTRATTHKINGKNIRKNVLIVINGDTLKMSMFYYYLMHKMKFKKMTLPYLGH